MSENSEYLSDQPISLTPEQEQRFCSAVKIGIYKELHKKGLLTDMQLNQLIAIQNKQ